MSSEEKVENNGSGGDSRSSNSRPSDVKTTEDVEIHSANSWETADLGDKKRNEKFLRLLGATKKEHHGTFVIGEREPVHGRAKKEEKHIVEELEEQYEQSMEHRLAGGPRGHLGLGFQPEEAENKDKKGGENEEEGGKEEESAEKEDSKSSEEEKTEEAKSCEKDERKRESSEEDCPSGAKKLKFVKASS